MCGAPGCQSVCPANILLYISWFLQYPDAMVSHQEIEEVRIDKWLWAARFFKTRSLSAEAVSGGKVHVNRQRVKPSRMLHVGDELSIQRGHETYIVTVTGLSGRRGPAMEAQQLYRESEQSREQRETEKLQRRLLADMNPVPPRRPNKKDRRHIIRFTRKQSDT